MLESGASFSKLLTVFVFTLVLFSLPAIVDYCAYLSFANPFTVGTRFAKYGEQIVTILPLVLLAVIRTRGKKFVIAGAGVALMWLLIFCSLGRVNYFLFGCVICSVLAGLLISKRHRRYLPRFAVLTALLIIVPMPLSLFSTTPATDSIAPMVSRLSDAEGISSSNNFRKMMFSVASLMIADHPVAGIGADNFGTQVNAYRERYGAAHPDDIALATAEDEIPEHAHNEFVQIVAELGAVGGIIFAWFLTGVAVVAFRAIRRIKSGSLYAAGAALGLGMFLVSSLVSSYSFRVMQNGIVFFFVLAVAAKLSFRGIRRESDSEMIAMSPSHLKLAFSAAILVCVGLLVYSGVRVSSVIIASRANQTRPLETARPLYDLAMRLDDENPDVRQNLGMRLFGNRRFREAIPYLESAVSIGRGPSSELSYLATAKSVTGDASGAEQSMASAAALYPRSPFVLTRYATLLKDNGKTDESADLFSRALQIDERSANTWRLLIDSGPKAVSEMAARDRRYSPVMDLVPKNSIYSVVAERFIKHPEEEQFSIGKFFTEEE
ncbi:MAG: O-antigen ligase family protein [Pyrinomonadaceae bacterium]